MSELTETEKEKAKKYYPLPELAKNARIPNMDAYFEKWKYSVEQPEAFWAEEAKMVDWFTPYEKVWVPPTGNQDEFVGKWFVGGKLNVTYNCLDRWVEKGYGDQTSLIWMGEDDTVKKFSYKELLDKVSQAANALKKLGVTKGDRVCLWLPMIDTLAIVMLACARIGAIHSIVFGGFSAESVKDRIDDSNCKVLVVADEVRRAGKNRPMKNNLKGIIETCDSIEKIAVIKLTGGDVYESRKDVDFLALMDEQSTECEPEVMDAEDPLFILYTSGTTGKPKGVVHTTAGYLVFGISTNYYVVLDRAGINHAILGQDLPVLSLIKGNLRFSSNFLARNRVRVKQSLDYLFIHYSLVDDLEGVIRRDMAIKYIAGLDNNDGPLLTKTMASGDTQTHARV